MCVFGGGVWVVVSILWNSPPKHHTIPAEVAQNDSEAFFKIKCDSTFPAENVLNISDYLLRI